MAGNCLAQLPLDEKLDSAVCPELVAVEHLEERVKRLQPLLHMLL